MRERLKRVSGVFFALFIMLYLLAAVGCGTDTSGNGDTAGKQAAQAAEHNSETGKDENADTGVSAFSLDAEEPEEPENSGAQSETENSENSNVSEAPGDLTVQILDVGQGSAALIHQNGHWMLVDGGDRETSSFVVSFLKEQGVASLDYVVVSHYDSDHLAGIVGVLNVFDCNQVLAPDYQGDTRIYESFLSVTAEKEIMVAYPRLGDIFSFGDSRIRVVSPAAYTYEDDNSNSLGIRLEYGETSFLLCGDCTRESEQDLLYLGTELDSDVYLANHHGSKYSNSEEFLAAVSPDYVVISSGKDNSYGHPDASVLLSVQNLGADLYRTDLQGTITVTSDGSEIRFQQSPCMDYRSGPEIAEATLAVKDSDAEKSTDYRKDNETTYNGKNEETSEGENSEEKKAEQYVLNTNTHKFHLPTCSSADDIKEENKEYSSKTRKEIIDMGYTPCKRCNP